MHKSRTQMDFNLIAHTLLHSICVHVCVCVCTLCKCIRLNSVSLEDWRIDWVFLASAKSPRCLPCTSASELPSAYKILLTSPSFYIVLLTVTQDVVSDVCMRPAL